MALNHCAYFPGTGLHIVHLPSITPTLLYLGDTSIIVGYPALIADVTGFSIVPHSAFPDL